MFPDIGTMIAELTNSDLSAAGQDAAIEKISGYLRDRSTSHDILRDPEHIWFEIHDAAELEWVGWYFEPLPHLYLQFGLSKSTLRGIRTGLRQNLHDSGDGVWLGRRVTAVLSLALNPTQEHAALRLVPIGPTATGPLIH